MKTIYAMNGNNVLVGGGKLFSASTEIITDDNLLPVKHSNYCDRCGYRLGVQNPHNVCDTCRLLPS
jgi:hypothetical protein